MSDIVNLTYGLSGDKIVHITDVQNGIACGCLCPECGGALIARQGDVRAWHFAHASGSECVTAPETALHKLAKQWLSDQSIIRMPGGYVVCDGKRCQVTPGVTAKVDKAHLESSFGSVVPDVYLELIHNNRCLEVFVEIAVTHFIDDDKRQKLADIRIPTLEVDLSGVDRCVRPDEFDKIMRKALYGGAWAYHPDIDEWWELYRESERRKSEARKQKAREAAARRKAFRDEANARMAMLEARAVREQEDADAKRQALAAVYAQVEANRATHAEKERQRMVDQANADRAAYLSKDAIGRLLHNPRCLACCGYLNRMCEADDPGQDRYACGECGRVWHVNRQKAMFDLDRDRCCPDCDRAMVRRKGPRGYFWGCSGFPSCRRTSPD